jgi:hypothetical protein
MLVAELIVGKRKNDLRYPGARNFDAVLTKLRGIVAGGEPSAEPLREFMMAAQMSEVPDTGDAEEMEPHEVVLGMDTSVTPPEPYFDCCFCNERSALRVDADGKIVYPEDRIFHCPYDGLPLILQEPAAAVRDGGGGSG